MRKPIYEINKNIEELKKGFSLCFLYFPLKRNIC